MFTREQLDEVKRGIEDGLPYDEIAAELKWRLSNGKANVSRVWRAVQRIKRDTAAAKGVKSFSTKDVATVGDAVTLAMSILKSIPRTAYMIPMCYSDAAETEGEKSRE